jgi:hypothetical protein
MRTASLIAVLLLAGGGAFKSPRTEPSLKELVRRLGAYVDAYGEKASIVVATERYTQGVEHSGDRPSQSRVLVSDFAIVRVEGLRGWMGFRDVIDVDGRPVENREARLLQSLMSPSASYDEARRISDESARFNIGPVVRNFNVPTAALFFFQTQDVDRFKFSLKKRDAGAPWEIGFRETERPTIIRSPEGRSLSMEGSVWVDPQDGTVTRTRIHMHDTGSVDGVKSRGAADVDVTYQRVATLEMWLPATMTESYESAQGPLWYRVTGRASYSEYRQFQTSVRIK